ncbi:MAG: DNA ligase D [Sphingomonadaceae bacterium]|nr:DNA ligase D [Sphingomonadaceae bacterium]
MARAADPLAKYNAKRDFAKTREPKGERAKASGSSFMVQKHDATRLHWDLRLEADGVLKSWAVTRGPSLNPEDKRLAVRTEDHPLSYATFEGTIPKGEYGGGTVMLWDRGTWAPIEGKSAKDLEKGHLHFTLEGERMKGEWLLIRLKPRPGEKRENWLLRKIDDEFAGGSDELVERGLTSVKTGRTMQQIANDSPATSLKGKRGKAFEEAMAEAEKAAPKPRKAKGRTAAAPKFQPIQLATLVDHVPSGNAWMHEMKYDGYRCLLAAGGGAAKAFTRKGLDWSDKFGPIVDAASTLEGSALIDGEIVVLDDEGRPNFSSLQAAISEGRGGDMVCFAFDLLSRDGEDLTRLPNVQRKERLRALVGEGVGPIRYAEHVVGKGEELLEAMCAQGLEGIISKKIDARYSGRRTHAWLKVKCTRRQEFVIVGWKKSEAKARPFSSLLLATREDGALRYAGNVGTGFDRARLDDLAKRFARLKRETAVVEVPSAARRGVTWLKPELVAEIAFAEFTADGNVRHASFLGLRGDKPADEVRLEQAEPTPEAAPSSVKISNPDRVIFPDAKITKGDLAAYYEAVAGIMLPWTANRPISLVRCPQGRGKHCFFQKHDAGSFGEHVLHVDVREKDGSVEPYLYVDDADGLLTCVQMGTLEFHGWGSRTEDIEKPDRLVFDLDPDVGLDFEDVKKAARDIKTHLSDLGLVSFPMLTGGKGVHVIVPLTPSAEWPAVKDFARRFAEALAQAEPERFVATMSKAKRVGRIFIDWLRNQRGATAIMPFAVRAREGAPVAAPIAWSELGDMDSGAVYNVRRADELLERAAGRSLSGWGIADQALPDY